MAEWRESGAVLNRELGLKILTVAFLSSVSIHVAAALERSAQFIEGLA